MKLTIYICNVCGKEHESKSDAVYCHPDIIEKELETYRTRGGELKPIPEHNERNT